MTEQESLISLSFILNLEYYVSPVYTKKLLRVSPEYERGDGGVGRDRSYEELQNDQLLGWLESNSLAIVRRAYPGSDHSDPTFLFSGYGGVVAIDTYSKNLRHERPFNESNDFHYQHFVRIRSPKNTGLPPDLTQTFHLLGYEQRQPTDDFMKRCPQFFKQQ